MVGQPKKKPNLLEGLRVGISGNVPEKEYWGDILDLDRVILAYVAQLSSLIIQYGGQVVHGSAPAFTPVLAEQARSHRTDSSPRLKLYASQLFGKRPEATERWAREGDATLQLTPKVGDGNATDPETFNESLTALRLVISGNIDVLIAIGGKVHASTGFNPGVLEELTQARWRDVPCFVVGLFGGISATLNIAQLKLYSKGNLLTDEEIEYFATPTPFMVESVGRLVLHLVKNKDKFAKQMPTPTSSESLSQRTHSSLSTADQSFGTTTNPRAMRNWIHTESGNYSTADRSAGTFEALTAMDPTESTHTTEQSEVIEVDPDQVKQASNHFSQLRLAIAENNLEKAEQLMERPSFLS